MNFLLADSFQTALTRLPNAAQKAVKLTVFDLQRDPCSPSLQFHRVHKSKDPNFWSLRVNRDLRLIVHKTKSSVLVAYVDHHDAAYDWAERRRIDTHPRTGAAQLVELRTRVEDRHPSHRPPYAQAESPPVLAAAEASAHFARPPFLDLTRDQLLSVGVPEDWLEDIHKASEDDFLDLADHIPSEAAEALLDYISSGQLTVPEVELGLDPFAHPDARRRFRVMDNVEELTQALAAPWDVWAIYLHPAQRKLATGRFSGPTRVAGSAGTGKTVVALHRAAQILGEDRGAKLLLTTFSSPLANALEHKLRRLVANDATLEQRTSVLPFEGLAKELFTLTQGYEPTLAYPEHLAPALTRAAEDLNLDGFTDRFLLSEWRSVIDAWQIDGLDAYAQVPRLGRKNRLGRRQREQLWPVFERTREILARQHRMTPAQICGQVAAHYRDQPAKPFTHIIVDEAQDLGVPELKMLAAIAPDHPQALFFAGDLGQRIFQEPFSWLGLGIDIRGRSHSLKVNYRTSHQIRQAADRLLPDLMQDVDGIAEDRRGTVSVFNGPDPIVQLHKDADEECRAIALAIQNASAAGTPPEEIGLFVRSQEELPRARQAVKQAGQTALDLSDRAEDRKERIAIGTMHLAKGLEFRQVIVLACDEAVLPDQDRINQVADEAELDEVYETERQLFYVACTRARETLILSGVAPASEFFADLKGDEK